MAVKALKREGFRFVYVLNSQQEIDEAEIVRTRMWNERKEEHGPFDIIGGVHGCYAELRLLLEKLGYIEDPVAGMLPRREERPCSWATSAAADPKTRRCSSPPSNAAGRSISGSSTDPSISCRST